MNKAKLCGGFRRPVTSKMAIATAIFCVAAVGLVLARPGGIDGYSGNPADHGGEICTACHSGGSVPSVTLDGPTSVQAGSESTFTLTIRGGQEVAGGLDVSATDGTLLVTDAGTYLRGGEITQSSPRNVDASGDVSWSFNWLAPTFETSVTLYGAGNSVNLANGKSGDNANRDTLTVSVSGSTGAATPGETSGNGYVPMVVSGFDRSTGRLSLTYESACETTGNNIYHGRLDLVSTYDWAGQACDIGVGGAYAGFDPGAGDTFFVVVGTKDGDEGSYGKDRRSGLLGERPPFSSNACGQVQILADRCD